MFPFGSVPYHTFPSIQVGPLELHTFGIFVGLGIIVGRTVVQRLLAASDVDLESLDRMLGRAVIVGLLGARLAWVLTHLSEIDNVLDVVAVWNGGLQFSGGFIAAIASAMPWLRRVPRESRLLVMDAAAVGLASGLAIGRVGCLAVGEHLGGPTSFLLGTRYRGGQVLEGPLVVGTTYHNTALYELLHLLVFVAVTTVLLRHGRSRLGRGQVAAGFLLWYGFWRSLTDLTRTADSTVLGLTGAQWVAVTLLFPGAAWLLTVAARRREAMR